MSGHSFGTHAYVGHSTDNGGNFRASYGHGVPPQVWRNQYDVPLPTIDVLLPRGNSTQQRLRSAHCYIALCELTELLGDLLPLVYGLQPKHPKEVSKVLRRMRTDLDKWEDSLPEWLKHSQNNNVAPVSGSSNLQLAFLAVKMLVCRVELQVSLPLRRHAFLFVGHQINLLGMNGRKLTTPIPRRILKLADIFKPNVERQRRKSSSLWVP